MKNTLTLLTTLALSASTFAHSAPLPHSHDASGPNWTIGVACLAALILVVFVVKGLSRKSRKAK